METQVCIGCHQEKPLSRFEYRKEANVYRNKCKDCVREFNKQSAANKVRVHPETQVCRICGVEKPIGEYHFRNDVNKYRQDCKECISERQKQDRESNPEKYAKKNRVQWERHRDRISAASKQYREKNKESLKEKTSVWREKNKESIKAQRAGFYQANKDRINDAKKEWYKQNKERRRAKQNEYDKVNKDRLLAARRKWESERLKTDVCYKLAKNLRGRVKEALKLKGKGGRRTTDLIGCTVDEARMWLESQFKDGMTWENYGKLWSIDHRIPVSWYNLENEHCLHAAFHYTNMQPLLHRENILKNNKRHDPLPIDKCISNSQIVPLNAFAPTIASQAKTTITLTVGCLPSATG